MHVRIAADNGIELLAVAHEELGHACVVRKHHPGHLVRRVHVRRLAAQGHLRAVCVWVGVCVCDWVNI